MSDRINLNVAADAIATALDGEPDDWHPYIRAALDSIHPALADLTPDDVRHIFTFYLAHLNGPPGVTDSPRVHDILQTAWEVLSR